MDNNSYLQECQVKIKKLTDKLCEVVMAFNTLSGEMEAHVPSETKPTIITKALWEHCADEENEHRRVEPQESSRNRLEKMDPGTRQQDHI